MLRISCPKCGTTVSIDPAIKRFECRCGKLLSVGTLQQEPAARKRQQPPQPAQAWQRPVPRPGNGTAVPRDGQPASPSAPKARSKPAPKPTAKEPTEANPSTPPDLSTFEIQRVSDTRTALNAGESEYPSDAEPPEQYKMVLMDVTHLGRTLFPFVAIACLLGAGFFYRDTIKEKVLQYHGKVAEAVRPKPMEFAPPPPQETDVADVDPATAEAVDRVLRTNVRVAIEGIGTTGAGVVCSIVGSEAYIVTNRSVVDQSYSRTSGKVASYKLPDVQLEYSDFTKARGEVVWTEDGNDLVIIRANRVGPQAQAADWKGPREVDTGDQVFFLDGPVVTNDEGETELQHTGIAEVRSEEQSDREIPIVTLDSTELPNGTGLFDKTGQLIAIAGPVHSTGTDDPAAAIVVSLLDQIRPDVLKSKTP